MFLRDLLGASTIALLLAGPRHSAGASGSSRQFARRLQQATATISAPAQPALEVLSTALGPTLQQDAAAAAAASAPGLSKDMPSLPGPLKLPKLGTVSNATHTVDVQDPDDRAILDPLRTLTPPAPTGEAARAPVASSGATVPGVQWKVYLPAGPVDTWPLAEEPYKRNVAAAADVPEDWVSILEAPNTSFSVTTQVAFQGGNADDASRATALAAQIALGTSPVLTPLRLLGPLVVQQVSRLAVVPVPLDARPKHVSAAGQGHAAHFNVQEHKVGDARWTQERILRASLAVVAGMTAVAGCTAIAIIVWQVRMQPENPGYQLHASHTYY